MHAMTICLLLTSCLCMQISNTAVVIPASAMSSQPVQSGRISMICCTQANLGKPYRTASAALQAYAEPVHSNVTHAKQAA